MRSLYATSIFLLVAAIEPLFGQQVHIVTNVPGQTLLRVATAPRGVDAVADGTRVKLHLRPADSSRIIPLIARSDTPYRLTGLGSQGVELRVKGVKPLAGTGHLMAGAASVFLTGPVATTHSAQTILKGPRISNGGNNATADNALLIELEVKGHDTDAELTLLMEPVGIGR
jgi:hypothetical protein